MDRPLIEGHWYKITPLNKNNVYKYYIGKFIESSIPPGSNDQFAYFQGVVRKNAKKGSYTEIGEPNLVMREYIYTEPTEGETLYAKSLFGDGELPKGPATYKYIDYDYFSKESFARRLHPPEPYGPPSVDNPQPNVIPYEETDMIFPVLSDDNTIHGGKRKTKRSHNTKRRKTKFSRNTKRRKTKLSRNTKRRKK
jgi:hypothetical protein